MDGSNVDGALDPGIVAGLRELAAMSPETAAQMSQLVDTFVSDATTRVDALRVAERCQDDTQMVAVAHSLAGSSANMGAGALADVCRAIEAAAASGTNSISSSDVDLVQSELHRAAVALRREFGPSAQG